MLTLFDLIEEQGNIFLDKPLISTKENIVAINIINNFIVNPTQYLPNALLLIGAEFSGKTHILHHLFTAQSNINNVKYHFIDFANFFIDGFNKQNLALQITNNFYIIENCELYQIASKQDKLLHYLNFILENGGFIVVTAKAMPNFSLPDLQSRIINFQQAKIANPGAETAKILLSNYLANKQIKVSKSLIAQLDCYNNFSYLQINDLLKILLFFYQEQRKMPNLTQFKQIIKSQQSFL